MRRVAGRDRAPAAGRARQVRAHAVAAAADSIEFDASRWEEYRLQPLEVLHSPESFLAPAIDPAAVQTNLDYWVDLQQPDGAWPLTWSWAEVDAEAWARAETDARGRMTVERLRTLRAHGRLDAGCRSKRTPSRSVTVASSWATRRSR